MWQEESREAVKKSAADNAEERPKENKKEQAMRSQQHPERKAADPQRDARPRLHSPDRQQLLSPLTIDELLEADHPARAVLSYTDPEKFMLFAAHSRHCRRF